MNYIKCLLHKLIEVDIIKFFSLNAISTFVRMLAGIVSVKVVAAIIGPAGVALLGQLNNVSSILLGLANGGINSGITKYVSEYKEDKFAISRLLSNALRITLFFTVIVALVLILLHNQLSRWIMLSDDFGYVFVFFGFTIIFYTLNAFLLSILNGYKEFKKYVVVNICGTIIGLIFSVTLVLLFGLTGAMINAVTFQSVMFFVTLWMCRKCVWLKLENFRGKFDSEITRKYLRYSLMTLTSLAITPVSQILLRGYVISEISITEAGWWEGMNRISNMYLSIITSSFSVYYLPRLSEIKDNMELRYEIFKCYKVIVPILLTATIAIYILRHFIIWLLFSPEFYPMENFFIWQMLGDFFKICSWLLSFVMVAKAMTKAFITTEIFFSLSFIVLGYLCMQFNGTIGLTQAYLANYILYLLCMIIVFKKIIFVSNK
ncbi:O-antigen translocase [Bacteroides faecalis]|uniref:LPS biosynthesis protein n=1 Tax=Bacteroides faecalis TaxID=2447885 RepID=A0A401LTC3_9BACE|nr:O-antigen translocase [Bacteroides faecalis]GCB34739.1 LPS biosynthesis protein [Bacteroides faecalis]